MNKMLMSVGLAFALAGAGLLPARAQTPAALTGQVTSGEEGPMEGVLVSAKKAGSTITITVVSDAQGNYSFPAAQARARAIFLAHSRGRIRSRPAGQRGRWPRRQPAKYDLKLRKTEDLAAQLSNAEWLASFPGTDQQKNAMLGCVGCHTLERVARSTHKPDDFIHVTLPRMQGYVNQSIPAAPAASRAASGGWKSAATSACRSIAATADFLAQRQSELGPAVELRAQDAAAPEGPRHARHLSPNTTCRARPSQPHDVVVDADGIAWYSSFGEQILGRLDPKTGKVTEYPVPMHKPASRPACSGCAPTRTAICGSATCIRPRS